MIITATSKKVGSMIAAGVLACTLGLGGAAAVAQPAYADITDGTSQSVEFTANGKTTTLTKESLKGSLKTEAIGYLYRQGNGSWYVCSVKDYISLDDLLAKQDATSVWKPGAKITFTTYNWDKTTSKYTEDVYGKYNFTYEALQGQDQFFGTMESDGYYDDEATPTPVPNAALAFSNKTALIDGDAATTAAALAQGDYDADTRFVVGLSEGNIGQTGDYNMGKRLPSAITKMLIS